MATAANVVYSHITQIPEVCGGQPCIDNTRVRVTDVTWLHKHGRSVEDIKECYPSLSLEQIYAALSYYYGHASEIDTLLEEDEGLEEEVTRIQADHERRRASR